MEQPAYGFDPAWAGEQERMALAATVLDPVTIGHLERLGVAAGWRCLEVGAGGGSIAWWLGQRVGPSGRVLATDVDTRFVDRLARHRGPALEVCRHDIVAGGDLGEPFDLAHTRLVLQHLVGRERAVAHMAGTLVPGGWLLAEEFDFSSSAAACPPEEPAAVVFADVERAIHTLLGATGFDPAVGRRLPRLLRVAGLADVDATGFVSVVPGGSPLAVWYARSIEALASRLQAEGLVPAGRLHRAVEDLHDPGFELLTPALISAWGRKPLEG